MTGVGAEQDVLAVLDALLAGIAAHDATAMRSACAQEGWATHVRDGRVHRQRLWDLPDRLPPGPVEERVHDLTVLVDEDVAMIWCAYEVDIDGVAHHWGTNIVTLVREDHRWVIGAITDNGRDGRRPPRS